MASSVPSALQIVAERFPIEVLWDKCHVDAGTFVRGVVDWAGVSGGGLTVQVLGVIEARTDETADAYAQSEDPEFARALEQGEQLITGLQRLESLHDVRRTDWQDHRAPGRGFLDFDAILAKLANLPYPHLLTFELEEPDIVPALAESKRLVEQILVKTN